MRGKTVKWIAIAVIFIVVGWTAGQVFEDISPYTLSSEISIPDILGICIDLFIGCYIAIVIARSLDNSRVEKDNLINELSSISEFLTEIEKECSLKSELSLQQTVYILSKVKKTLLRVNKYIEENHKAFSQKYNPHFVSARNNIQQLNSQLTDSNTFNIPGFIPININNNLISLNPSVKNVIDNTFANIRDDILKLKLIINQIE